MATVYLHIGIMKTASTAIQSFLVENRGALEKKGYTYPAILEKKEPAFRRRNGHFLIYRSRTGNPEEEREVRAEALRVIRESAERFEGIILSDEVIWRSFGRFKNFWPDLLDDLGKLGCSLKVIVYLRSQDDFIESVWNQYVKGNVKSPRQLSDWLENRRYSFACPDFYQQLKRIEKYVGKENMVVRIFEKGRFEGKDHSVFSDFLQCVGLPLTEDFTREHVISNYSLQGNFIELKRLLNGLPEYQKGDNFLEAPVIYASNYMMQTEPAPKASVFSPEERKEFMAQFQEGNERIAREYFGREDGVLFSPKSSETPQWKLRTETMDRDLLMVMTEAFCQQNTALKALEKSAEQDRKRLEQLQKKTEELSRLSEQQQKRIAYLESREEGAVRRAYRKVRTAVKGQK